MQLTLLGLLTYPDVLFCLPVDCMVRLHVRVVFGVWCLVWYGWSWSAAARIDFRRFVCACTGWCLVVFLLISSCIRES